MFTIQQEMRAWSVAFEYVLRDENVQVNGFIFIFDLTGIGAKHMTRMSSSDVRKWHSHWQVSCVQWGFQQTVVIRNGVPPPVSLSGVPPPQITVPPPKVN